MHIQEYALLKCKCVNSKMHVQNTVNQTILLTKTTAARNGAALSYPRVRGLYFLAVVFVAAIYYYLLYVNLYYCFTYVVYNMVL